MTHDNVPVITNENTQRLNNTHTYPLCLHVMTLQRLCHLELFRYMKEEQWIKINLAKTEHLCLRCRIKTLQDFFFNFTPFTNCPTA